MAYADVRDDFMLETIGNAIRAAIEHYNLRPPSIGWVCAGSLQIRPNG